jgi:two-component system, NtrC family, nitrogen regulation sensor histidine kinase NtrY
MTLRTRLFIVFALASLAGAGFVAWGVARYAQQEFARLDRQRSDALVAQFQREFAQRGEEAVTRLQGIADAEGTLRMAIDLNRPQADFSVYANDARGLANTHQLDFLELVAADGTLISSAQYPGRIGDKNDWVTQEQDWNQRGAFLARVDVADGAELGLLAVRAMQVGNGTLYLIGGLRVDRDFLGNLVSPPGMRVLLYPNLQPTFAPAALVSADGTVPQAERFAPLIASASGAQSASQAAIQWAGGQAGVERFTVLPLLGRKDELLGTLLVGSEQKEYATLLTRTAGLASVLAASGVLLGIFLSWWFSARVTRPLARLEAGTHKVAAGDFDTQVVSRARDEVGQAVRAFNDMTRQLAGQRLTSLQAERVAAWREVSRRMAQESKEHLFPLHVAVENLRRARNQSPEQFHEAWFDSLATLTAELENLKATVTRFSDFAKMPAPRMESVNVNDALRSAVKLFEPQFSAIGRPPVRPDLSLDERTGSIAADPAQLFKALESLLLRSLDSMPAGGTLTIRTRRHHALVTIEVSDTGTGLTPEECARLFTPYYAATRQAAGLGLATVQSVVSNHGGKISAESAPGAGTTFRMEFPAASNAIRAAVPPPEPTPRRPQRELPQAPVQHQDAEPVVGYRS